MKDDLIKTYNLSKDDFWTHKQSGNLIITHKACEKIARQEKIVFDMPKILSSENNNVAILCSATWGDTTEWSIGEASPKTSFNIYYFDMAEKRVKDRLILKLIGVYGDVYSEDESDEFRRNNQSTPNVQQQFANAGIKTEPVPDGGDRSDKPFHPNAKGEINTVNGTKKRRCDCTYAELDDNTLKWIIGSFDKGQDSDKIAKAQQELATRVEKVDDNAPVMPENGNI